MGNMTSN